MHAKQNLQQSASVQQSEVEFRGKLYIALCLGAVDYAELKRLRRYART